MKEETLSRYIQGCSDEKERIEVLEWIEASEENRAEYLLMRRMYESCLMQEGRISFATQEVARPKSRKWVRYACSFAAVALLVLGLQFGGLLKRRVSVQSVCSPLGQQTQVDLSDGTRVWLNSDSELLFTDLTGKRVRRVSLRGEAYFEVAHDEKRPFIVSTEDFDVKVLGTKFNVNTCGNRKSVALVDGSVNVLHGHDTYALEPQELFFYDTTSGDRGVFKVQTDNYVSWINGYLDFKQAGLDYVLTQLQNFYGGEFVYDMEKASRTRLSGKLELRDGLEAALNNLKNSKVLSYSMADGTVKIKIN